MHALGSAVRSLRHAPAHVVIVVLTLALGIGVNTAMFSVIDAVLFRSGPFPNSRELVQVMAKTSHGNLREFAEAEQREIREQSVGFTSLATIARTFYSIAEPGRPAERIGAVLGSAEMFATFGMQPFLGRAFTVVETQQGKNQVVVLSYRYWQQRLCT